MTLAVPRLWLLWYAVLGGLVAWTVHLVGGYFLIELVCDAGRASPAVVVPSLLVLTALPALAAGGATLVGVRLATGGRGWRRTFAFGGALIDATAFLTILLGATQLFALPPCA